MKPNTKEQCQFPPISHVSSLAWHHMCHHTHKERQPEHRHAGQLVLYLTSLSLMQRQLVIMSQSQHGHGFQFAVTVTDVFQSYKPLLEHTIWSYWRYVLTSEASSIKSVIQVVISLTRLLLKSFVQESAL